MNIGEIIDNVIAIGPSGAAHWGGPYWELYHDCGTGQAGYYERSAASFYPAYNCLANQVQDVIATRPNWTFPPATVPAAYQTLIVGLGWDFFAYWYLNNNMWFRKVAGFGSAVPGPVLVPGHGPLIQVETTWPEGVPEWVRTVAPEVLPPQRFAPIELPLPFRLLPYWKPSPYRSPFEQTEKGNSPKRDRDTQTDGGLNPGAPSPPPAPPPHTRVPPKRGKEKERKFKGIGLTPNMAFLLTQITEPWDMLEEFYDALPDKWKPNRPTTVSERAGILWEHFNEVDVVTALAGVLSNIGGDYTAAQMRGMGSLSPNSQLDDTLRDARHDWNATKRGVVRKDKRAARRDARYNTAWRPSWGSKG